MAAAAVEEIPKPGLLDTKKVELYTKWRPLLPLQFRDITCPHPGNAVLNKIKNKRNKKATRKHQKAKSEVEK
eukprot:9346462-Ditylum_brightwellii.AAC.1